MMITISRGQRSLLFFLSASGYVAWFAGVGAPLNAQNVVGQRIASLTIPASSPLPRVAEAIRRDPFEGAPQEAGFDRQSVPPASAEDGTARPTQTFAADFPDNDHVPNIATGAAMPDAAQAPAPTLVVRATIVGRTSVAYVANGSEMDIVRVGDSLGDRRVVKIDIEGIAFDDGTRLDLAAGYDGTPAPVARKNGSVTVSLDQLRKLLRSVPATAVSTPVPPPAPPTAEPSLAPAQSLPTADVTGLIPGQNPTSNPGAPTAFPYPYPYPPSHR